MRQSARVSRWIILKEETTEGEGETVVVECSTCLKVELYMLAVLDQEQTSSPVNSKCIQLRVSVCLLNQNSKESVR